MSNENEDPESKTEEATQQRLESAVEKGQIINSREVTNFLVLFSFAIIVCWILPITYNKIGLLLKNLIENSYDIDVTAKGLKKLLTNLLLKIFIYLIGPFGLVMLASISSSLLQQGQINFSAEPIMPQLSRISPLAGFGRIFSIKAFVEFVKNILKIVIIFICLYLYLIANLDSFENYQYIDIHSLLIKTQILVDKILLLICIITAILAGSDYFYQRFAYYKSLRMSKEEIKQEYKQSEGQPEIKQKIRSLGRERIRTSLQSVVPQADVIITNPTHFSIALKYNDNMAAPILIAKGQDLVALKIREIAKTNNIIMVENKALAQALFYNVKIDEEIPIQYYEAVAQVISYVYKLRGKK